jgi:twitching motility protein PilT
VGKPPVIRLHGSFEPLDPTPLTGDDTERLMKEICPPRYQQMLQEQGSCDFAYAFSEQARFRTNIFRNFGNIAIVMRLIPSRIFSSISSVCPRNRSIRSSRPTAVWSS